jgi:hypothetical protein
MANNKKNFSTDDINDGINELAVIGESSKGVTLQDAFNMLENTDVRLMQDQTREYFNFDNAKAGDRFNFFWEGNTTTEMDNKQLEVAKLIDKEGKKYINGNAVLVRALKQSNKVPAMIAVVYNGTKKSNAGTYADLSVYIL